MDSVRFIVASRKAGHQGIAFAGGDAGKQHLSSKVVLVR